MNFLRDIKTSDTDINAQKKLRLIKRVVAVAACVLIAAALVFCYLKYGKQLYYLLRDAEHIREFLSRFNGFDRLVFVALRTLQTVVKLFPAAPLEIGSGVLYGTWGGLLLCFIGTELGTVIIIALTKVFGRRLVNLFIPIEKVDSLKFLQDKKMVYRTLFVIYLLPGAPKDTVTYAAALTDIDMKKFFVLTSLARIPAILSSTWCGDKIMGDNFELAIIIFAASLMLTLVCSFVYKKVVGNKNKSENGDEKESTAEADVKCSDEDVELDSNDSREEN